MKITILCVGKIKEKFYVDAITEYSKRISAYSSIEIHEVEDEKAPENMSPAEELQVKNKEGEKISKLIPKNSYIISLAIEGKKFSSEALEQKISQLMISGTSSFTFIIGGSLGLSQNILKKSDMLLSFSDMTFPHQLMRVILLEQLYRTFKIRSNEPYHK